MYFVLVCHLGRVLVVLLLLGPETGHALAGCLHAAPVCTAAGYMFRMRAIPIPVCASTRATATPCKRCHRALFHATPFGLWHRKSCACVNFSGVRVLQYMCDAACMELVCRMWHACRRNELSMCAAAVVRVRRQHHDSVISHVPPSHMAAVACCQPQPWTTIIVRACQWRQAPVVACGCPAVLTCTMASSGVLGTCKCKAWQASTVVRRPSTCGAVRSWYS